MVGADLDLDLMHKDTEKEDALLFGESPGRFVVSVKEEHIKRFEEIFSNCLFAKVGRVRGDHRVIIRRGDKLLVNEQVEVLKVLWNNGPEKPITV